VLISDPRYDENISRMGQVVNVLIHEVVTGRPALYAQCPDLINIRDHHTTPQQVGRIFTMASPRLAVFTLLVNLSAGSSCSYAFSSIRETRPCLVRRPAAHSPVRIRTSAEGCMEPNQRQRLLRSPSAQWPRCSPSANETRQRGRPC
jgi:hypothetical protein